MRLAFVLALGLLSTAAGAASPGTLTTQLPAPGDRWQAKAHEIYQHAIEVPTVEGRGQVPALAQWLADQYRAGGWGEAEIPALSSEGNPGNHTAALVVRWPAARPSGKKPILLMAHMDVVEAKAEDWSAGL